MNARENVIKFWPDATIKPYNMTGKYSPNFQVTIRPGRHVYGDSEEKAWMNAFDAIVKDDELCRGAQKGKK